MIWKVPKLWENGRCFIIGGGTSMPKQFNVPDELIQQVCKEKQSPSAYSPYMKSIRNEHIIGINDAYRLGNWVDILFFGDYQWYLSNRSALSKWTGLTVTCAENFVNKPKEAMEGVKCLARDKNHKYGISLDSTKVSWNGNSGAAAISLAVHLGVKSIYLLGFDMCLVDNKSHWHNIPKSTHPVRKNVSHLPPFDKHLIGFPQIAKDAKQMGVDIINLSPISKIEQFPKMQLKDVINE